jgi:hypothetical protein
MIDGFELFGREGFGHRESAQGRRIRNVCKTVGSPMSITRPIRSLGDAEGAAPSVRAPLSQPPWATGLKEKNYPNCESNRPGLLPGAHR